MHRTNPPPLPQAAHANELASATAHAGRAELGERRAGVEEAVGDWQRILALDLADQHPLAAYNIGNALLALAVADPEAERAGDSTVVFEMLQRALAGLAKPSADAAYAANRLAEAHHRWGRGEEAESEAPRWGEQAVDWARPSSAEALLRVAWDHAVRSESKDPAAAAAAYLEVIDAMGSSVVSRSSGALEYSCAPDVHGCYLLVRQRSTFCFSPCADDDGGQFLQG